MILGDLAIDPQPRSVKTTTIPSDIQFSPEGELLVMQELYAVVTYPLAVVAAG